MRRLSRALVLTAIFLASLAGTARFIQAVTPAPYVPEFSEKLLHLARNRDAYDVVFLGSSRVRRQISPEVFDRTLHGLQIPLRSYNLGLDGLGVPEILYVADRILELKSRRLKYIFIEVTRFPRDFGPLSQPDSKRTIYWHTPAHTLTICRAIWNDPEARARWDRITAIHEHVQIGLSNWCRVGRGPELVEDWSKRRVLSDRIGAQGDGFFPIELKFPESRRNEYQRQLANLLQTLDRPSQIEPLLERCLLTLLNRFEREGITPVIVTMPRIHPAAPWTPPTVDGRNRITLRFDDPRRHPDLFSEALHYDPQHLNAEGAQVFSQQLALHFAETLQSSSPSR